MLRVVEYNNFSIVLTWNEVENAEDIMYTEKFQTEAGVKLERQKVYLLRIKQQNQE